MIQIKPRIHLDIVTFKGSVLNLLNLHGLYCFLLIVQQIEK